MDDSSFQFLLHVCWCCNLAFISKYILEICVWNISRTYTEDHCESRLSFVICTLRVAFFRKYSNYLLWIHIYLSDILNNLAWIRCAHGLWTLHYYICLHWMKIDMAWILWLLDILSSMFSIILWQDWSQCLRYFAFRNRPTVQYKCKYSEP